MTEIKNTETNKKSFLKKITSIFKPSDKVAVIRLSGIIGSYGFKKGLALEHLEEDINKAFKVSGLKAIALQVDSPGGSPVQSELIYNYIRKKAAKNKIPVFSFAEDLAASGGYWLVCTGDEIYASASSIIGSIGVISAGFGYVEAIKRIGIERRIYKQGENKAILDPFSPENAKDIEILNNMQKKVHDVFKDMVKERRGHKIEKADPKELFSGAFWCGKDALELGLIDGLGDMHSIIKEKFGDKIKFVNVTKPKSLLKRKLGLSFSSIIDTLLYRVEERFIRNKFGL